MPGNGWSGIGTAQGLNFAPAGYLNMNIGCTESVEAVPNPDGVGEHNSTGHCGGMLAGLPRSSAAGSLPAPSPGSKRSGLRSIKPGIDPNRPIRLCGRVWDAGLCADGRGEYISRAPTDPIGPTRATARFGSARMRGSSARYITGGDLSYPECGYLICLR